MKHFFGLSLALILWLPCFANKLQGRALIDSLERELPAMPDDSTKVLLLNRLGYAYYLVAPDTGLTYGDSALKLARSIKWEKGVAAAFNTLGVNHEAKTNHPAALAAYKESLALYRKLRLKENIAGAICNMANIYSAQGNTSKALDYYFEALRTVEAIDDKMRMAMVRDNIGSLYFQEKDHTKANAYFESAFELYRETGDELNMARTQANIGLVLNADGKYKDALGYLFTALEKHTAFGNKRSQSNVLVGIGDAYDNLENYPQALRYKQIALDLSKEIGNEENVAIATGNLGITWFKMARSNPKDLNKAIGYLEDAVSLCKGTGSVPPLVDFSQYLSKAYFLAGKHRKAYEVTADYLAIKDSVYSAENKIKIARLETDRELALVDRDLQKQKAELRIKELELSKKRSDQFVYTISILLLLLATGSAIVMFLNSRKVNQTLKEEKNESKTLLRTHEQNLKKQRRLLHEISHVQSHEVRGAVATILGLSQLFNSNDYSDPTNETVVEGIRSVAHELDGIVKNIITKENDMTK